MKKDAVQNERDRISSRKTNNSDDANGGPGGPFPINGISAVALVKAEALSRQQSGAYAETTQDQLSEFEVGNKQLASISDISESMKQQLLVLVEWAKQIPSFSELSLDDQVALLRAHAGEHLLLGVARRSMHLNGILLLGNDMIIAKDPCEWGNPWATDTQHDNRVRDIGIRVMNELATPFRELGVDDTEFACLKAIVFFDPHVRGLADANLVHRMRRQIQTTLEDYISER